MKNKKRKKLIRKEAVKRYVGKPTETFLGFRLNKGKYNQLFYWNTLENC